MSCHFIIKTTFYQMSLGLRWLSDLLVSFFYFLLNIFIDNECMIRFITWQQLFLANNTFWKKNTILWFYYKQYKANVTSYNVLSHTSNIRVCIIHVNVNKRCQIKTKGMLNRFVVYLVSVTCKQRLSTGFIILGQIC